MILDAVQDCLPRGPFVRGYRPKNGVESADTQGLVIRDRDAMMRRRIGLNNDVTAGLVDLPIRQVLAESRNEGSAVEIARDLHAVASSSSRTKWSRMILGISISLLNIQSQSRIKDLEQRVVYYLVCRETT